MTQELNCSDAAKMLIERMATHPNDFEPGERFWGVMKYLIEGDDIGGFHIMSKRDVEAITAAAQQLHENKLMEYVLHKLLVRDEAQESRLGVKGKMNTILTSAQMARQGSSLTNSVYSGLVNQQVLNQYQNAALNSIDPYPTGGTK